MIPRYRADNSKSNHAFSKEILYSVRVKGVGFGPGKNQNSSIPNIILDIFNISKIITYLLSTPDTSHRNNGSDYMKDRRR